jgi:hypothetical protein
MALFSKENFLKILGLSINQKKGFYLLFSDSYFDLIDLLLIFFLKL